MIAEGYAPHEGTLISVLEAGDATTYLDLHNGEVGVLPPEGSALSAEAPNVIGLIS
jgi:hypothetical protein